MFAILGAVLVGAAVWIFSQSAGAATIGEVRGIAGLCGLLIGAGLSLVAIEIIRLRPF